MENITINLSAYGAGLGLIMVGWMAGLVVSYVLSIIHKMGQLG